MHTRMYIIPPEKPNNGGRRRRRVSRTASMVGPSSSPSSSSSSSSAPPPPPPSERPAPQPQRRRRRPRAPAPRPRGGPSRRPARTIRARSLRRGRSRTASSACLRRPGARGCGCSYSSSSGIAVESVAPPAALIRRCRRPRCGGRASNCFSTASRWPGGTAAWWACRMPPGRAR